MAKIKKRKKKERVTQAELDEIIKEIKVWTPYYREDKTIHIDYDYTDFKGKDLSGLLFPRNSNLVECDFTGADLSGCMMNRVKAYKSNFKGAKMVETSFCDVHAYGASFEDADLSYLHAWAANFGRANLDGTNFYKANIQGCSFFETSLVGTNFTKANMKYCNLDSNFGDAIVTGTIYQADKLSTISKLGPVLYLGPIIDELNNRVIKITYMPKEDEIIVQGIFEGTPKEFFRWAKKYLKTDLSFLADSIKGTKKLYKKQSELHKKYKLRERKKKRK